MSRAVRGRTGDEDSPGRSARTGEWRCRCPGETPAGCRQGLPGTLGFPHPVLPYAHEVPCGQREPRHQPQCRRPHSGHHLPVCSGVPLELSCTWFGGRGGGGCPFNLFPGLRGSEQGADQPHQAHMGEGCGARASPRPALQLWGRPLGPVCTVSLRPAGEGGVLWPL